MNNRRTARMSKNNVDIQQIKILKGINILYFDNDDKFKTKKLIKLNIANYLKGNKIKKAVDKMSEDYKLLKSSKIKTIVLTKQYFTTRTIQHL